MREGEGVCNGACQTPSSLHPIACHPFELFFPFRVSLNIAFVDLLKPSETESFVFYPFCTCFYPSFFTLVKDNVYVSVADFCLLLNVCFL